MNRKPRRSSDSRKVAKHLFSPFEDSQMRQLVSIYGLKSWKLISRHMKDRTARQCRERWKNYLSPDVRNGPWTIEEDNLLLELVPKMGTQWAKIAKSFNSRTDTNVKNRFLYLQRSLSKSMRNQIAQEKSNTETEQASSPESMENMKTDSNLNSNLMMNQEKLMIDFWDQSQWEITDDSLL